MSTPSRASPYIGELSGTEGKLIRALLGGNPVSIAKAALLVEGVREAITTLFKGTLNQECRKLCQKGTPAQPDSSLYRSIPVGQCAGFRWTDMMAELEKNAPLLLSFVQCLVTRNDHSKVYGIIDPTTMEKWSTCTAFSWDAVAHLLQNFHTEDTSLS